MTGVMKAACIVVLFQAMGMGISTAVPKQCNIVWKEEIKQMCETVSNKVCKTQPMDLCHKEYETKCSFKPTKNCENNLVCRTPPSGRQKRSSLKKNLLKSRKVASKKNLLKSKKVAVGAGALAGQTVAFASSVPVGAALGAAAVGVPLAAAGGGAFAGTQVGKRSADEEESSAFGGVQFEEAPSRRQKRFSIFKKIPGPPVGKRSVGEKKSAFGDAQLEAPSGRQKRSSFLKKLKKKHLISRKVSSKKNLLKSKKVAVGTGALAGQTVAFAATVPVGAALGAAAVGVPLAAAGGGAFAGTQIGKRSVDEKESSAFGDAQFEEAPSDRQKRFSIFKKIPGPQVGKRSVGEKESAFGDAQFEAPTGRQKRSSFLKKLKKKHLISRKVSSKKNLLKSTKVAAGAGSLAGQTVAFAATLPVGAALGAASVGVPLAAAGGGALAGTQVGKRSAEEKETFAFGDAKFEEAPSERRKRFSIFKKVPGTPVGKRSVGEKEYAFGDVQLEAPSGRQKRSSSSKIFLTKLKKKLLKSKKVAAKKKHLISRKVSSKKNLLKSKKVAAGAGSLAGQTIAFAATVPVGAALGAAAVGVPLAAAGGGAFAGTQVGKRSVDEKGSSAVGDAQNLGLENENLYEPLDVSDLNEDYLENLIDISELTGEDMNEVLQQLDQEQAIQQKPLSNAQIEKFDVYDLENKDLEKLLEPVDIGALSDELENLIDISELTREDLDEVLQQLDQEQAIQQKRLSDAQLDEEEVNDLENKDLEKLFEPVDISALSDDDLENLIDVSELTGEDLDEVLQQLDQDQSIRQKRSDCEYVEECFNVNRQICEEVPTEICEKVEEEICWDEPSEKCKFVKMKVAKKVCEEPLY